MPAKDKITSMFDGIAPSYDKLNHILSLNIDKRWRRKAMDEIADTGLPVRVLDVACGTGDFTVEIAQHVPAGSHITGIDLSEGMLQIGRSKLEAAGIVADMVQGDGEALPYPDNTFDRIAVGFGVRNFEHLELGLSEMLRVLKPNGKLVILELSVPSNPLVRGCYRLYFLKLLPAIGGWISGDSSAYEYLPASVLHFPSPDKFISIMQGIGFVDVRHRPLTLGICRMYIGQKS